MIKDTGPGIASEDIARIGEFGHRGSTTRDIVPGEGVGLWGVYRYMELMGGTVNIKSEVGKGTIFILSFQSVATDA
jgi:signal transduction histidine kinase